MQFTSSFAVSSNSKSRSLKAEASKHFTRKWQITTKVKLMNKESVSIKINEKNNATKNKNF